jgi:TMEM175 potassium channel family protein
VSYLFIAIVWTNHHYLMRYATEATSRLLWFNFAHLFSMSLLPFSTAWMAVSELAPQPVAFYAAVFFLVNATYVLLIWELIERTPSVKVPPRVRRIMRLRSIATLCLFGVAAVVALKYPLVGLGICISCLIVYLKPHPPGAENRTSLSDPGWRPQGQQISVLGTLGLPCGDAGALSVAHGVKLLSHRTEIRCKLLKIVSYKNNIDATVTGETLVVQVGADTDTAPKIEAKPVFGVPALYVSTDAIWDA